MKLQEKLVVNVGNEIMLEMHNVQLLLILLISFITTTRTRKQMQILGFIQSLHIKL